MKDPVKNCTWLKYPLGDVTQWYGENPELYMKAIGQKYHSGIDIVKPHGTHMYAVEDGRVSVAENGEKGYSKYIKFKTPEIKGECREWVYGHMDFIGVKKGQKIKAGQFVGTMGNTGFVISGDTPYWTGGGNSYGGTHLHIGYRIWKKGVVQDYDNGVYGRLDPVDLIFPPKALIVFRFAQAHNSTPYFKLAHLLKKINV